MWKIGANPVASLHEVNRIVACSSMPVAIAKMFRSKMMSSAGKPGPHQRAVDGASRNSFFRAAVSAWPASSKAMTTTAAPWRRQRVRRVRELSLPFFD